MINRPVGCCFCYGVVEVMNSLKCKAHRELWSSFLHYNPWIYRNKWNQIKPEPMYFVHNTCIVMYCPSNSYGWSGLFLSLSWRKWKLVENRCVYSTLHTITVGNRKIAKNSDWPKFNMGFCLKWRKILNHCKSLRKIQLNPKTQVCECWQLLVLFLNC